MKALRSPWVSGVLAVAAAALMYFQIVKPQLDRRRPARMSSPSPAAVSPTPATAPAQAAVALPSKPLVVTSSRNVLPDGSTPKLPIDRTVAAEAFNRWVEAPARDPFLLVPPPEQRTESGETVSPIAQWRLSGVYRQTGSRVAAINSGVYSEGDFVQGFKLAKIENDQVWLQVSNRLERLSLGGPTNNAPATAR